MKPKQLVELLTCIVITNLTGMIGSAVTSSAIPNWYANLVKPSFNPPPWVFGPVWIILYILMGISLYLIWSQGIRKKKIKTAVTIFAIQLILNALWSPIFFGLNNIGLALIVIILMWLAIAATIYYFYKLNKNAAYLLIPYILWISFAAILNLSLLILN